MDDMTRFEHRLADDLGAMAGPGRRIDAMAMVRSASTRSARWRFTSMFSALKFVVAGAIVALFGGFLLAGVLTQPSEERAPAAGSTASADPGLTAEPTPVAQASPDLLPGVDLDLDEIEPGVFAVLDDGADHRLRASDTVEVASDMTAWVSTGSRLFQLGRAGSVTTENGGLEPLVAAATHGDLLLVAGRDVLRLESTSGPVRTEEHAPPRPLDAIGPELGGASWATAISAAPDGTAWASWSRGNAINSGDTRLVRYDGERWEDHSGEDGLGGHIDLTSDGNYICDIESGQGDETWVGVCGAGGWGWGGGGLFRHGESGWEAVSVFADVGRPDVFVSDLVALAAGADGTTWALVFPILAEHADAAADDDWSWADEPATDPFLGSPILARHRDGSWSAYRWDDVSPDATLPINTMSYAGDVLDVDDRGVLWVRAGDTMAGAEALLSFDGEAVREYRAVTHIGDLSVDGAGRVWVAARNGLTVIDPSIAAATTREVEALAAPAGTATASTDTATSTTPDLLPGVDLDTDETKPGGAPGGE